MLAVHVTYNLQNGGVSAVVKNLIFQQEKLGIKTAVVTLETNVNSFLSWINNNNLSTSIYLIEKWRTKKLTVFGCLSRKNYKRILLDNIDEDIVFHFHNPISFGLFSYIPQKSLCTIHGQIISNNLFTKSIFKLSVRRFLSHKAKVIGCCNSIGQYYAKMFNDNSIQGVINGVESVPTGNNKYIIDNDRVKIGYFAYIDDSKGWCVLKNAFELLEFEDRNAVDLYFAGPVNPICLSDFNTFVNTYENVYYLGYIKNGASDFLPFLDVLILPSRSEGMPMSILEAMQARTAIIATNVGGIPEVVIDGISGFLVNQDERDIAKKISNIVRNTKVLNSLKIGAYNVFRSKATAELMALEYKRIYDSL